MMQIFEEVRKLVVKIMEMEKWCITMDSMIENDLGMGELDLLDIIIEIEKEYKIDLEDMEINKLKTIRCLTNKIQEKIEEKCKKGLTSDIKVL